MNNPIQRAGDERLRRDEEELRAQTVRQNRAIAKAYLLGIAIVLTLMAIVSVAAHFIQQYCD